MVVTVLGVSYVQVTHPHQTLNVFPRCRSLRPDGEFQVDVSEIMNGPNLLLFR